MLHVGYHIAVGAYMAENRWRELCEAIMKEQDPQRLSDLVKELNIALDERELELRQGGVMRQEIPAAE